MTGTEIDGPSHLRRDPPGLQTAAGVFRALCRGASRIGAPTLLRWIIHENTTSAEGARRPGNDGWRGGLSRQVEGSFTLCNMQTLPRALIVSAWGHWASDFGDGAR